jgi:F-type H+-transporting ATPase subunit epsilon
MRDNLYLEIRTPDAELFRGEVSQVVLPGKDGLFGVLKNHAPMIATLTEGKVKIDALHVEHIFSKNREEEEVHNDLDNRQHTFEVKGGVVEILNNQVMVLAS